MLKLAAIIGLIGFVLVTSNDLQWQVKGKTPVLTLYPIGLDAGNVEALNHAAAAWNDTGYVRFVVAPLDTAFPFCNQCIAVRVSETNPFTRISTSNRYIEGATVFLLNGQQEFYTRYTAVHELGHVLGLGHVSGSDSIMGTVIIEACPQARDIQAVSKMYPYLKGAFTVPNGFTYPLNSGC